MEFRGQVGTGLRNVKAVSVQITHKVMRWENSGKGESEKKSPQFEGWGFPVFRGWRDKEDPTEESREGSNLGEDCVSASRARESLLGKEVIQRVSAGRKRKTER